MMTSLSEALEKVQLDDTPLDAKKIRDEEETDEETVRTRDLSSPFRFFDLPSEIRLRIYWFVLFTPRRKKALRPNGSVGASSKNPPISASSHRIALFLASRRLHDEATDYFYSRLIFRLFPIQDYCRTPTIRFIPYTYLSSIPSVELLLGSSWTAPPSSWTVNRELGLEKLTRLRTLRVFVECDPSHPIFEGFRVSKAFYTDFAGGLLQQIVMRLPNLINVEFDANPSVRKDGDLMKRLLHQTRTAQKNVLWGPQRGWTDRDEEAPKAMVYELPGVREFNNAKWRSGKQ
ncbi:hypothetical protein FE257_002369 [Aspergillus nanangensis]|uniref:Uncharacterized protein n=1 Tax=Aspergillus nanangensis TaxID=2582783 RepID=A0AAD4CCR0_ASPNN|nr:hypothetical protein FE257_002369 [Aspergillus nanangensis]